MKKKYGISKILLFILLFILLNGLSFLITAGILKLILVCFGLEFSFSWKTALGVWLILLILNGIGSVTVKTK